MPLKELQQLLQALDERNLSSERGHVASAFESRQTAEDAIRWVQRYVTPDTLLTREERVFHENHVARASTGRAAGLPIPDEELETALSALEASSASIERQCRLLEAQKHAIQGIVQRNASSSSFEGFQARQSTESARDRAQVDFDLSEMTESLRSQLTASTKQADSSLGNFPSSVERIIERDDRLLDGLEKVLTQFPESTGGLDSVQEVHRLCDAFAVQLSADVRLQIDAAYQQAVQMSQSSAHKRSGSASEESPESKQQKGEIQAEVEGLCQEIDGLSTMAVDSQYRIPISRALRTAKSDEDSGKALWTEYMVAVLQYMTTRMKTTHDHFQHAHSHKNAVAVLSATFDGVISASTEEKQSSLRSPAKHSQKGLKPLRLVQANLSESQDPVTQLLRLLELRPQDSSDAVKFAENLSAAAREQRSNSIALSSRSERGIADLVAQSLSKAGVDAQALLGAIFASSEFGDIQLLRSSTEGSIDRLESGTDDVGDQMRALDVGDISGNLQEKQRLLLKSLQE